jgi:hypothetical protein
MQKFVFSRTPSWIASVMTGKFEDTKSYQVTHLVYASSVTTHLRHRIKTRRRSTHSKKGNRCHAMIRHQNADAIVLASALMRGIPPWTSAILNIIRGVNASHKRAGAHGVSISMTNYGYAKIIGKTVGLLYSRYSVSQVSKQQIRIVFV